MKLSTNQIKALVDIVFKEWREARLVQFKVDEKEVVNRCVAVLENEYKKEQELEKEVHKMLDQLEKSHGGSFERFKMYPMLKAKLAKERKIIL